MSPPPVVPSSQPPLALDSVVVTRQLLGSTTTVAATLRLARDVDPLDVHRRLLELVAELNDAHADRRELRHRFATQAATRAAATTALEEDL